MKTIAILNLKGGVGKTTTSANLAYNLSKQGYKVLAIDCDKQGNLSKILHDFYGTTLSDLLLNRSAPKKAIQRTKYKGLDIVTADIELLEANQQLTRHDHLSKAIKTIAGSYDYCIIDCAPNIDMLNLNVLACADEIIVPVKIDGFLFDSVNDIMEQVDNIKAINPKLTLRGCLVTSYTNDDITNEGIEQLKMFYKVFDTKIPYTKKVISSTTADKILAEYSPTCGASKGYKKFTDEYLEW